MLKISIPQPCHEDWQKMTPTSKGAFCKACAKEVVDFTKMTDEQVQNYLLSRTTEKLCGRFQPQQLSRIEIHIPAIVFTQNIAAWKKYLAILLLAFGTLLVGCDVKTDKPMTGVVVPDVKLETTAAIDTTAGQLKGMTVPVIVPDNVCPIEGEIAILPDPNYGIAGGIQLFEDSVAMPVPDTIYLPTIDTSTMKPKENPDSTNCTQENYW